MSFLTALQNDERANFQLDVKFQESYLNKVVSLLQCQLSEGAVLQNNSTNLGTNDQVSHNGSNLDEIEEGELPDGHGEYLVTQCTKLISTMFHVDCSSHYHLLPFSMSL